MDDLNIVEADLDNREHQQAIVHLINAYAQLPTVSGESLPEQVQGELIDALKKHPTTEILLAYCGSKAVGIATCFLGFSTFAAKPLLNLHDLAVLDDYQGQGVGRELLRAVECKAKQLGCCKVTLEVFEDNHVARNAYKSAGFQSYELQACNSQILFMHRPLASE